MNQFVRIDSFRIWYVEINWKCIFFPNSGILVMFSSSSPAKRVQVIWKRHLKERNYHGKLGLFILKKLTSHWYNLIMIFYFRTMIIALTIYNLSKKSQGLSRNGYFHWRSHIAHFIDKNWSYLMEPSLWVNRLRMKFRYNWCVIQNKIYFSNKIL